MSKNEIQVGPGVTITTSIVCNGMSLNIPPGSLGVHEIVLHNKRPKPVEVEILCECEPPGPLEYLNAGTRWPKKIAVGPKGRIRVSKQPCANRICHAVVLHQGDDTQTVAVQVVNSNLANPVASPACKMTVRVWP